MFSPLKKAICQAVCDYLMELEPDQLKRAIVLLGAEELLELKIGPRSIGRHIGREVIDPDQLDVMGDDPSEFSGYGYVWDRE